MSRKIDPNATFTVYSIDEVLPENSLSGMTATAVAHRILRDDGQDYRLQPEILRDREDYDGNKLPDGPNITDSGNQVYEVWFKSARGKWEKSHHRSEGKDEDEAMDAFLLELMETMDWLSIGWVVEQE